VLAGADAVARTAVGSVLVEAVGGEPQRACPRESGGTRWDQVLFVLVAYRLLAPGSEWRLHREWFQRSALADLLGEDAGVAEIHKLYRCHDRLLAHKQAVFDHLTTRWRDLFNISYDVLLYDLTSTYFESDPPFPEGDKRRFGYSRDHRPDCVQIIIALVVTPEGLPLAYEVLPGNTADKTTLRGFLDRIERQYGKARRVWLMDRGVPTEEVLAEMRAADPPVHYLVGTPKGRLTRLEKHLIAQPWQQARPGVQSLPQRRLGSSCWRKKASSTSWRKAATASPRNGQCGNAS
jgi:transposase